jgi:hypothetical protein
MFDPQAENPTGPNWTAVQIRRHRERLAEHCLKILGFAIYAPAQKYQRRAPETPTWQCRDRWSRSSAWIPPQRELVGAMTAIPIFPQALILLHGRV